MKGDLLFFSSRIEVSKNLSLQIERFLVGEMIRGTFIREPSDFYLVKKMSVASIMDLTPKNGESTKN